MDWGLFSKDAGENRFLREQIVYDYKVLNNHLCNYVRRTEPVIQGLSGKFLKTPRYTVLYFKASNFTKYMLHQSFFLGTLSTEKTIG